MHSPSGHYSDSSAVNTHHKDWKILFSQNCSHLKRHYAECSYTVQNIHKLFDNLCTHWRADHSLNVRDGWLEIQEELSISFIEKTHITIVSKLQIICFVMLKHTKNCFRMTKPFKYSICPMIPQKFPTQQYLFIQNLYF